MWLDRLSSNSTPSGSPPPSNRSLSPAPRRSMHLNPETARRPSYTPRSSSLANVTRLNASTASLPGTPRLPPQGGSALRQELTPPVDFESPIDVLKSILGCTSETILKDGGGQPKESQGKPDIIVKAINFKGLSLHEYANRSGNEPNGADHADRRSRVQSVEEFEKEKDKFDDLHQSILACDDILKSVEISLTSFQKDLGTVSAEIETLQARSHALNTKLENRKVVEKLLGPAVEEISISPNVVMTIAEGPMNENWIKALQELENRAKFIESKFEDPSSIRAVTDIKPLLDNLVSKALERIRDYLVAQIKALRSPNMNAQVIQRQKFLPFKELFGFLARHHAQLAEEIGQAYINTMRWYYLHHFTRYRQALDKLSLSTSDKHDVLGADQGGLQPAMKQMRNSQDPMNLGRRMDILNGSSSSAISSYLAEEDSSTHHIEVPFRNFNLALIDNASMEYSFLTEFFQSISFHSVSRKFGEIFDPTFSLGQSLTRDLIDTTNDCFGLLLCVRLNQHQAFELQRRKVPVADGYINATNMLLWPKFQLSMDMHCESIRRLATGISNRSTTSTLSFGGGAPDTGKQSTAPHPLTQRFGQFLDGILAVSHDAGDDEPVLNSLLRLRNEFDSFLSKASKTVGGDARKRDRFLSNNYSLVLTIIADTEGKLAQEHKLHYEDLKKACRD